ncbi:4-(cytidine 5'-diphospho)-2-C-methyl-D-erythritol kinase [Tahibacter soli]|jgi:4-diphosphocytidyl-2-C-methyl-D-erythritol kinase|uniref:4-diphosphocytidyl-2-C-methyl-D-erythritol kinase n=1 Tax=Tahibacter soli TaxID=2983605 RepID=A0A9X4BHU6_9GAMM|nr:4-(cytidine 5'-diphospho)-2-C-methyl-D-erythritol kinase [Tahibacter soli]MDC8011502.1 4-(cytidine 5'-diphospho)-2-C-methyl-D-erythritol kinase [Tahibacter soli]
MTAWTRWPAPAKLNLFLNITGRRADGYHTLQTMFQLLDWGDEIALAPRADGRIERVRGMAGVAPHDDLVVRAAQALQPHAAPGSGVDIAVDKRVPAGGGLGGGSSDAATVLVALNAIWRCGLSVDALAHIGLALGADVPVFVRGRSAWADGIGEILTPVDLPERWYVVVDPQTPVPTGPLFQAPELTRDAAPTTIPRFLSGAEVSNAFEPVVAARYPAVAQALIRLGRYGRARLSGSGGCVFVDVAGEAQARQIVRDCPEGCAAYAARGVNRSPLLAALEDYGDGKP